MCKEPYPKTSCWQSFGCVRACCSCVPRFQHEFDVLICLITSFFSWCPVFFCYRCRKIETVCVSSHKWSFFLNVCKSGWFKFSLICLIISDFWNKFLFSELWFPEQKELDQGRQWTAFLGPHSFGSSPLWPCTISSPTPVYSQILSLSPTRP